MSAKPKIIVWCNSCSPEWHVFMALAEDGAFLASHVCSHHGWGRHDMGFDGSEWKHEHYNAHYPDGWELFMVEDPKNSPELDAAYAKNQARKDAGEVAT